MKILSKREVMANADVKDTYFFDIVFEWEDILSRTLQKKIVYRSKFSYKYDEICRKIYRLIKIPFFRLYNYFNVIHKEGTFMFDVACKRQDGIYNNKKYIPCIIDFFYQREEYPLFINAYKNNELVLLTSMEVYEYLKDINCPLNIYHFPLSIPDYLVDMSIRYEKKYDLILAGRQNPILSRFVEKYEKNNNHIKIVKRKEINGHYEYYLSSTGEVISSGETREEYWNLLKMSKVALYTTPSMDGTREKAHGWNQVTPRFLEELAAQCHVIARYPDNPDTRWYELNRMCSFVDSYDAFEKEMNRCLKEEVDLQKYKDYLNKHSTSSSAQILKEIMVKNNLF